MSTQQGDTAPAPEQAPSSGRGLLSNLYFAAGAASGLVEGYVLLCRTLATELTGGKGLKGLVHGDGKGAPADEQAEAVIGADGVRIVSVPRGMSAADLAAELAADPAVQAALGSPAGGDITVEFLDADGQPLNADELQEVAFAFAPANGHGGLGSDSGDEAAVSERPARRSVPLTAQGVLLRTAWWAAQEEDLWSHGVGPIRHRRPATARICLSKFLTRQPVA